MADSAADRNLLFGLLALQNGLIDQDQLVAAFQAWTRDKGRPLADHLVDRGDLDADQRAVVEAMVGLHLKKHGGEHREEPGRHPRRPLDPREPGRSSATPRSRRPSATSAPGRLEPGRRRRRPHRQLRRRHGHLRRPAVPRPAAPRPGRPGRRLRGARQRAAPRGGAQADPRPARRRPDQPRSGSCSRPRSPAGWSTPASSRSTAWAPTATAGPTTPCGSSAATRLKEAIDRFHADEALKKRPRPAVAGAAQAPAAVHRRLQRHRLRAQPRRAAPRHQAGQHHRRQARRDAGGRLGAGQGRWAGSSRGRTRASGRWCRPRPAAVPRRCRAAPWGRRPT